MTSLDLFQPQPPNTDEPPEWGTGRLKSDANLWVPKAPSWHYTGKPIEQHYTLTQLKNSNLRTNDQLLPDPKDAKMGPLMIDEPFPAEHPFASHTPRFAVFPKFDSPEDPKRGVDARTPLPKHAEMPSQPYDVTIINKTKGSGLRHEVQELPSEAEKKALVWNENNFDQKVKSPWGGQQSYYPSPIKTFVPNLEKRSDSHCIKGNMEVTPRTANALRNVERNQWQTTYDLSHTGLGPSNALKLDNLEDKMAILYTTGIEDDSLRPRSKPTFDPPRAIEGRITRLNTPKPEEQTKWEATSNNPNYQRKMTLSEKEEDRLLNGNKHTNLPEGDSDEQWKTMNDTTNPDTQLETLVNYLGNPEKIPFQPAGAPEESDDNYLSKMDQEKHDEIQQMEASNRWKLLESQKPYHDVSALKHKMDLVSEKEKPDTFYEHEGKFQRERAGLYKTSYDPYSLQYSMNKDETSGGKLFDKSDCHKNALDLPVQLNQDMVEAMKYGRTLGGPPGSVPQYNGQPNRYETFEPFNSHKSKQKSILQPNANTTDVITQENGIISTESTKGSSYNTPKFLQENSIPEANRKEPLVLMSHENQNLNQIRSAVGPRSRKSVHFSKEVTVADGAGTEPIRLSSADLENPRLTQSMPERPFTTPAPTRRKEVTFQSTASQKSKIHLSDSKPSPILDLTVELPKNRISSRHLSEGVNQFESRSTNIQPTTSKYSWATSSAYEAQFPTIDLGFKSDDPRFHYRVGTGLPRPQSSLLQIQDSFTKTNAKKTFYDTFPETNPDLRENITRGKRHVFNGINAQTLRGAPVVA